MSTREHAIADAKKDGLGNLTVGLLDFGRVSWDG